MFLSLRYNLGSRRSRQTLAWSVALGLIAFSAGCRADRVPFSSTHPLPEPPAAYPAPERPAPTAPEAKAATTEDSVVWDHLGSWTGRGGSMQTESFPGETGAFRIKWEARTEPAKSGKTAKDADPGTFKVTIHSAISGRPLQVAVEQSGAGADTAYVNEDPRVFFAVVDASHIEWSFSVEEAVGMRVSRKR